MGPGIKDKKPFIPNTRKTSPNRMRAINAAIFTHSPFQLRLKSLFEDSALHGRPGASLRDFWRLIRNSPSTIPNNHEAPRSERGMESNPAAKRTSGCAFCPSFLKDRLDQCHARPSCRDSMMSGSPKGGKTSGANVTISVMTPSSIRKTSRANARHVVSPGRST
jgi:hypothetical protein